MQIRSRVIRLQSINDHVRLVDVQTVSESGRDQLKDLVSRARSVDNERIVQAVVETNLNKCAVGWLCGNSTSGLNHLRHVCWNSSRGSRWLELSTCRRGGLVNNGRCDWHERVCIGTSGDNAGRLYSSAPSLDWAADGS